MKNKIISLSGGLDSTILTYKIVNEFESDKVKTLTFNYGQRHSIEVEKAKLTCKLLNVEHKIIDISFLGNLVSNSSSLIKTSNIEVPTIKEILGNPQPVTYVPYRNLIFLALTLSFAESNDADEIFIASQSQDLYAYWDNSQEFINKINEISQLNRLHEIKITAPFVHLTKADEIKIGKELKVPFENCHTCYNPNELGESCGKCPSCAERIKAFMENNLIDPISYQIDIPWTPWSVTC